jgi:Flp pilus assembly protein TadG
MNSSQKPDGAVSIIFSILLLVLFGFAALAVDLGYMAVAKSELQNSADAGARAGALRLYINGSGPNWADAQQRAEELAELNPSAGNPVVLLSPPEVGYWNLDARGQTIQSTTGFTPTAKDLPAVKVIASRTGAGDGGPISTLFARTLEIDSAPMSATAIAVVSGPGYVDQRNLFPFAMSQCMYDAYWNTAATPPGPVDSQKLFPLTNTQNSLKNYPELAHCPNDELPGRWTSLKHSQTSAAAIKDLIGGRVNPALISIGEEIPLLSGVQATIYGITKSCSKAGDSECRFVTVPVVATSSPGDQQVIAFACLEIVDAQQGGKDPLQNTFTVRMTQTCDPPGSGGIGPDYGFKPKPKIVQ